MVYSESKVFKDEDVLSPEYLPEILPYRETQVQEIARNLLPASRDRKVQNTFIFGAPGIGKTASVKFIFRKFEEEFTNVRTIYINCWDFNTSISVLSETVISIGFPVQRRGWAKDEIIKRLIEALNKSKKNIIVCLDEVDQLVFKDQSALYDLLRINQYSQKNLGLVFISNDPHVFANLEPRITSSLSINEIEFRPYTIAEMKNILQERARRAFQSLEDGVIAVAANHAIQKGGDVRVGLQLLLKAGRFAEQQYSDKVKVVHLKKFLKETGEAKQEIIKEKITDIENMILEVVEKEKEISFGELYKKYESKDENAVTKRRLWDYVNHLAKLNMLKVSEKVGRKRIVSIV